MQPIARWSALLIALLAVTAVLAPGAGAQPVSPPPDSVRVLGTGLVIAAPDIATLSLGASVQRESPAEAFSRAEELAAALARTFAVNGVAPADVQTVEISLRPEFVVATPDSSQPRIGAWRASHIFSLRLRDFSRIAPLLEAAVTLLGADAQVQGIFFGIEDTDALISRARAEAFTNARDAAEELARLAGDRLGDAVSIEEFVATPPTPVRAEPIPVPRPPLPSPAPQLGGDFAGGPIAPGQIQVRVSLTIVFALIRPPRAD